VSLKRSATESLRLERSNGDPGIADAVAERVLNHVARSMAGVYNKHDYLDEMRLALDQWAAHLTGVHKFGT